MLGHFVRCGLNRNVYYYYFFLNFYKNRLNYLSYFYLILYDRTIFKYIFLIKSSLFFFNFFSKCILVLFSCYLLNCFSFGPFACQQNNAMNFHFNRFPVLNTFSNSKKKKNKIKFHNAFDMFFFFFFEY